MKKLLPIILVFCLLLCSCGGGEIEAPETITEPETVYYLNPLNGKKLTEPYSGRVFAVTINNVSPALPHKGLSQADIFFEMFINDYLTRGLALFSDVRSVDSIGSVRSTRLNFTDIAQSYSCVLIHSGGSKLVLNDLSQSGVDQFNGDNASVGYRDHDRSAEGYSFEHTLFVRGEAAYNYAAEKGYNLNITDKDYGLKFAEEGTPDGEAANELEIIFTHLGRTKNTLMTYDSTADAYTYYQYGKTMTDADATVYFKNVIVILAPTENLDVYHVADLVGSGDGYFACGGRYVRIRWTRADDTTPFTFTMADGSDVKLEAGSTYIAIAPTGSPVNIK